MRPVLARLVWSVTSEMYTNGDRTMVSKRIQKALLGNSAIRAMFVEGKAMAEKYGAENV